MEWGRKCKGKDKGNSKEDGWDEWKKWYDAGWRAYLYAESPPPGTTKEYQVSPYCAPLIIHIPHAPTHNTCTHPYTPTSYTCLSRHTDY